MPRQRSALKPLDDGVHAGVHLGGQVIELAGHLALAVLFDVPLKRLGVKPAAGYAPPTCQAIRPVEEGSRDRNRDLDSPFRRHVRSVTGCTASRPSGWRSTQKLFNTRLVTDENVVRCTHGSQRRGTSQVCGLRAGSGPDRPRPSAPLLRRGMPAGSSRAPEARRARGLAPERAPRHRAIRSVGRRPLGKTFGHPAGASIAAHRGGQ